MEFVVLFVLGLAVVALAIYAKIRRDDQLWLARMFEAHLERSQQQPSSSNSQREMLRARIEAALEDIASASIINSKRAGGQLPPEAKDPWSLGYIAGWALGLCRQFAGEIGGWDSDQGRGLRPVDEPKPERVRALKDLAFAAAFGNEQGAQLERCLRLSAAQDQEFLAGHAAGQDESLVGARQQSPNSTQLYGTIWCEHVLTRMCENDAPGPPSSQSSLPYEEWFRIYKDTCAKQNKQLLASKDGTSLIDFMEQEPLKRAHRDGVSPVTLAQQFASQFDLSTFGKRSR